MMNKQELLHAIETKKAHMIAMEEKYGIHSDKVLTISQELDKMIVQYQKKYY